jgi:hypothetical protein
VVLLLPPLHSLPPLNPYFPAQSTIQTESPLRFISFSDLSTSRMSICNSVIRASPAVLSMWPFSHPSLVIYFFQTPPMKLKLGLQIGEILLIANHLDKSLWSANQKQGAADHISYNLLWQVWSFAVPFTSLRKLCKIAGPKPFCWAKLACFDFSSSSFNLKGHTLITSGVAIRFHLKGRTYLQHSGHAALQLQWTRGKPSSMKKQWVVKRE